MLRKNTVKISLNFMINNGNYLLALIRRRKSNWLHVGSIPMLPTNCYAGNPVSRPACEIEKLVP